MDVKFTPLSDFYDEDLRSLYCAGLNYSVRPGNAKLAAKVDVWIAEKKVRLGTADGGEVAKATVKGTGEVR